MEFIHPFYDGNGRIGRLWQTIILMRENPVFEFVPVETAIKNSQEAYYQALSESDKAGLSTKFIEYLLEKIKWSLEELIDPGPEPMNDLERLSYYLEQIGEAEFSRKDYMRVFPQLSSSTASRDLRKGLETDLLIRIGADRLTRYRKKK